MLEPYAVYSTELTDEECELGFERVQIQVPAKFTGRADSISAVAYRFSQTDQIVKLNVPVIGGSCYRHERLRPQGTSPLGEADWVPVGSVVFPTADMALNSIAGQGASLELSR